MWQLVQRLTPELEMPPDASKALQRCAEARADVIEADLRLPGAEGKKVLLEVINGGCPPAPLASNPIVVGLQSACLWLKWLAISNLPDLCEHCEKMKPLPANPIVAYLYQAVEDLVLSSWVTHLAMEDPGHDFANSRAICLMELQAGASNNDRVGGEEYCESEVRIGDILLDLLRREWTQAIENGTAVAAGKLFRCPLNARSGHLPGGAESQTTFLSITARNANLPPVARSKFEWSKLFSTTIKFSVAR